VFIEQIRVDVADVGQLFTDLVFVPIVIAHRLFSEVFLGLLIKLDEYIDHAGTTLLGDFLPSSWISVPAPF
jgi:hypothetical protein